MTQRLQSDDRTAFPYGVYDADYECPQWCDRYAPDGSFSYWQYVSDNERRTSDALELSVSGRATTAGVGHQAAGRRAGHALPRPLRGPGVRPGHRPQRFRCRPGQHRRHPRHAAVGRLYRRQHQPRRTQHRVVRARRHAPEPALAALGRTAPHPAAARERAHEPGRRRPARDPLRPGRDPALAGVGARTGAGNAGLRQLGRGPGDRRRAQPAALQQPRRALAGAEEPAVRSSA